jgi:ABC-type transport system involved in multi-copper enzyme maturation permease subunit
MSRFFGVFRHEFNMSIRRPGLWIAYGLLFLFYTLSVFWQSSSTEKVLIASDEIWQFAGRMSFTFNLFLPVATGILAADRMQRDFRTSLRELQLSTPLRSSIYILGKYFGVTTTFLLPILIWIWLITCGVILLGVAPPSLFYTMTLAFFTITLPAIAFVTAFSLALPLIMPLRVYQILFTGYWFWGNYLNPDEIPTLSGTYLTPGGMFATQGYFGAFTDMSRVFNATEATINLLTLATCIFAVLLVTKFYLERQIRRS